MLGKLLVAVLTLLPALAAADDKFAPLGTLPGGSPGLVFSSVAAVTGDGSVAVGASSSAGSDDGEAFRWQAGKMTGLGFLSSPPGGGIVKQSAAYGVSDGGDVVVGDSSSTLGLEAVVWKAGVARALPALFTGAVDTGIYGIARAVTPDGALVAGEAVHEAMGGRKAVLWIRVDAPVEWAAVKLGPAKADGLASGISADGNVVVGSSSDASSFIGGTALRWEKVGAGGYTELDLGTLPHTDPGFGSSAAYAVSADGSTVVGGSYVANGVGSGVPGGQLAFRWTTSDHQMHWLGSLLAGDPNDVSGFNDVALSASQDGTLIVGSSVDGSGAPTAFIWDAARGVRDLRAVLVGERGLGGALKDWQLTAASHISPDGKAIAGIGTDPGGRSTAWLVVLDAPLVPPPPPDAGPPDAARPDAAPPAPDAAPPAPDATPPAPDAAPPAPDATTAKVSGGGCAVGPAGSGGAWVVLLLPLLARRRRR
jgi:uncharacterized membrane protein